MSATAPELEIDPFSLEFLRDPHPHHVALREAAPVVRLSQYNVWSMARHAEVSSALHDHESFCSGRGGGLTDFAKEKPWRPPSIILEADPPLHTRTRGVLAKVLSRPALMSLRQTLEAHAERLVDQVVEERCFDAVPRLAQAFPLNVFPDAVGLTTDGRENLLPYGDMAFNAFGPRNELLDASMRRASEVIAWITAQCRREALTPDGFGAQVYREADAGVISETEAALLVRSLLTAGLDTTIHGIAHALHCFARFPDQWQRLRENPALVRNAFEEVIRFASPVQTFFRTTTRAVDVSGTIIPEGEKVLLFLAAANRDPRRWVNAEQFDIERQSAGHVGFGYGIHQCVGQMVARMEAEILLTALVRRVDSFAPDAPAVFRLNNTLRGLASLPLRIERLVERRSLIDHDGMMELTIARKQREARDICSFDLVHATGAELPAFTPGAHLDVEIRPGLTRQYSLCNDPQQRHRYVIAVLREQPSRGGSQALHEDIQQGATLRVSQPKAHFALADTADRHLLLAGGIGITPLLSMAEHLARSGDHFELHYCARSHERTAFLERIQDSQFSDRARIYLSEAGSASRLDIDSLLRAAPLGTHLYVCGPRRLIDAALTSARSLGWPEARLHYEFFAGKAMHTDTDGAFEVELARSRRIIRVAKDQTVVQALQASGLAVPVSCEQGVCGTCLTRVLGGTPDHRDSYLTAAEQAANDQFTPCCSRSHSARLVLAL